MNAIIYDPNNVGTEIIKKNGVKKKQRKYHLNDDEIIYYKNLWKEYIKTLDEEIINKSSNNFFNPYREGIYRYQINALYLLGCNEWHSFDIVINKIKNITEGIVLRRKNKKSNFWKIYFNKKSRMNAIHCKDVIGRIEENYLLLQRLSGYDPLGYKLYQVGAAIDIKRIDRKGLRNGFIYYRLSTYDDNDTPNYPIRDYNNLTLNNMVRSKIKHSKFIGSIIYK